ncbi:branched-chain amino acid ABC transporter permease [Pseudonocardia sichuanensis]
MLQWFNAGLFVNVLDGVAIGGLLFLLAVGLTMIFGLVDMLNLGHGALYLAGGYAAFLLLGSGSVSLLKLVVVVILVAAGGAVAGVGLGAAVKPLAGRGHLDQALLTLGLGLLVAEAFLLVVGRGFNSLPVPTELARSLELVDGNSYPLYRLVIIGVSAIIAVLTYIVFERTRAGSLARATVDDPQMVAAMGVNVGRVRTAVVVAGAALAAVAGVLGAPLLNLRPGVDTEVLVLALIVVVIGGLGSIKGAVVGALLIGQVQTLGVSLLPELAAYALFGVMVLVLLVRPGGLFGREAT